MPASGADRRPAAVQALLTDLCRAPVVVERWERLEPWAVARVLLGGAGAARTVIVKWVRTGPAQARAEPWRLRTELAALQFLSDDLGLALAPRVIAADVPAGFLVLEDLAPRVALDRLIRRDGAAACLELLAVFARACGELSAATAGQAGAYHARCAALGSPAPAGDAEGRLAGLWDRGREDAAALGAPIAGSAASELIAVLEELNAPGPFLALSHGDAESNNILVRESGPADARLIDFEAAGYAHALIDAVCLHVPGPGGYPSAARVPPAWPISTAALWPGACPRRRTTGATDSPWQRPACPGRSCACTGSPCSTPARRATTAGCSSWRHWNPPPGPPEPTAPCPTWPAGPGARPVCCAAAGPTRTWTSPTGRGSRPIRRAVKNASCVRVADYGICEGVVTPGSVSFTGFRELASSRVRERRQPGLSGDGVADGVECGDAVGGGGVEVAADAAPAGEGGEGVPVA